MQDHKINLLTPGSIRRNTESFSCQWEVSATTIPSAIKIVKLEEHCEPQATPGQGRTFWVS